MDNEVWKDVVGWEGIYQVSNLGRVKSLDRTIKHKRGFDRFYSGQYISMVFDWNNNYYGVDLNLKNKSKRKRVHRLIAEAFLENYNDNLDVDHINGIRTDNRLCNLRMATREQNNANSVKQANTSSKYKGVCYDKNRNKWIAFIRIPGGKRLSLGRFDIEEDAARIYDEKLLEYFGEYAKTNEMLGLYNHA